MRHPDRHIFGHTPDSLAARLADAGEPRFRAEQILDWVYSKRVTDPLAMSNLPARLRERLAAEMAFTSADVIAHERATDGTQKLLVQWWDGDRPDADPAAGNAAPGGAPPLLPVLTDAPPGDPARQTECVMIPSGGTPIDAGEVDPEALDGPATGAGKSTSRVRKTACISSQVGCPVGCRFCASGLGGLDGNLSAGRIVEQVWRLAGLPGVGRITNVVFMGMGEPLANLRAVVPAVRAITAPWGMGIGARRVTVSTVGLPRAIERLADELDVPVTLALSLHAPNDALRRELIPWAEHATIDQLLEACDAWFRKTGREITLEYILLGGVNDRPEHARELADVARRLRANVNLIRYNEVAGLPFERPRSADVRAFQKTLRDARLNAHIRASRGRDIAAACGQLRHEQSPAG